MRCPQMLMAAAMLPLLVAVTPPPSVKDVMKKVGAYVDAYGERASIVVATERYTQDARGDRDSSHSERTILAELAIVKIDSSLGWQGFRDVLEVDGRSVADRADRLIHHLLSGGEGYLAARRLSDESARFNIGVIARNFNVPTSALFFFRSEHQDRFKFTAMDAREGIWHLEWREVARPTFIRTPEGRSIPTEGELWVDPSDGSVRRTLLKAEMRDADRRRSDGHVDVTYAQVQSVGMWLPATMDEEWVTYAAGTVEKVRGHAEYSNYRKFSTSVRVK